MDFEMLSDERVVELAYDYEISKKSILDLFHVFVQTISQLEDKDELMLTDPDFMDRVFEYAVSCKSSNGSSKNGGTGSRISDTSIAIIALYKSGLIPDELFANNAEHNRIVTKKRK